MPRITLLEFAILVALTMVSLRAFADDPGLFATLRSDPAEEQRVINAAARSTVVLQNPCSTTQFRIANKFVPIKPVSFDGAGAIVGGARCRCFLETHTPAPCCKRTQLSMPLWLLRLHPEGTRRTVRSVMWQTPSIWSKRKRSCPEQRSRVGVSCGLSRLALRKCSCLCTSFRTRRGPQFPLDRVRRSK